jgi:4-hydroxythreonine-4-phosphate dehydrogenase
MGDPAGIGPEIAVKALMSNVRPLNCKIIVIGDYCVIERAAGEISPSLNVRRIGDMDRLDASSINILDMNSISL